VTVVFSSTSSLDIVASDGRVAPAFSMVPFPILINGTGPIECAAGDPAILVLAPSGGVETSSNQTVFGRPG
jgi:hypothetical protein